jgi:anti-sigma regulatory factor (Ser/Thr protein kinase)
MQDLSLHILDIAENSINASAKNIDIRIVEDTKKDMLTIEIIDDGKGMNSEFKDKVIDPFTTTRTTRKVGLGIPLLKAASEIAGGRLTIESAPGTGTIVTATFQLSHIDRKPVGSMADTILTLAAGNPEINIRYIHKRNGKEFVFDTKNFLKNSNGSSKNISQALSEMKKYLKENSKIK